jgi:hypothetical protein
MAFTIRYRLAKESIVAAMLKWTAPVSHQRFSLLFALRLAQVPRFPIAMGFNAVSIML